MAAAGILVESPKLATALLLGIGVAISGPAGVVLALAGLLALVVISACTGAVRQVFSVALYRYAVDGRVQGAFTEHDLQEPFTAKRGGRWLRPGR